MTGTTKPRFWIECGAEDGTSYDPDMTVAGSGLLVSTLALDVAALDTTMKRFGAVRRSSSFVMLSPYTCEYVSQSNVGTAFAGSKDRMKCRIPSLPIHGAK